VCLAPARNAGEAIHPEPLDNKRMFIPAKR